MVSKWEKIPGPSSQAEDVDSYGDQNYHDDRGDSEQMGGDPRALLTSCNTVDSYDDQNYHENRGDGQQMGEDPRALFAS